MNAPQDFRSMTADTVGRDLLQAIVTELKLLPDPWPKLPKKKQDDIIDRLRNRVTDNVKMAVHLLAAEGRIVVAGDLDQITIKDGVKAVVKFSGAQPNLHQLYDVAGKQVLVVVANAADHTGGMEGAAGEGGNVIEGEVLSLPAPGDTEPTDDELAQAEEDGYQAAADGKAESDCPVMSGKLCIAWVKGWKHWHELSGENQQDPLYERAVATVRANNKASISLVQRSLMIGYNRAARLMEEMEKNGVVSEADAQGCRTVLPFDGEQKAA